MSDIPFLAFISRSKILASNFVTVEPLYSGVFACFLMSSNFFRFFHQGNLASQHKSSDREHLTLHYMPNSRTAMVSLTSSFTISRTVSFSFMCPVLPTFVSLLRFRIPAEACSSGGFSPSSPCFVQTIWFGMKPLQSR